MDFRLSNKVGRSFIPYSRQTDLKKSSWSRLLTRHTSTLYSQSPNNL
jgi:hypothetical protein